MKIDELLSRETIFLDLEVDDKIEVIEFLSEKMSCAEGVTDTEALRAGILRRESEIPTGLEKGAAIPHARTDGVSCIVMAFARLKNGIDFGAHDGEPVRLVFQLGIPKDQVSGYLKILAKLSRLLKKTDLIERLLKADNADEVIEAFREQ